MLWKMNWTNSTKFLLVTTKQVKVKNEKKKRNNQGCDLDNKMLSNPTK